MTFREEEEKEEEDEKEEEGGEERVDGVLKSVLITMLNQGE